MTLQPSNSGIATTMCSLCALWRFTITPSASLQIMSVCICVYNKCSVLVCIDYVKFRAIAPIFLYAVFPFDCFINAIRCIRSFVTTSLSPVLHLCCSGCFIVSRALLISKSYTIWLSCNGTVQNAQS